MYENFVQIGIALAFLIIFINLTWKAGADRRALKRGSRMYRATQGFRDQLQELSSETISIAEKLEKISLDLNEEERQGMTSEVVAIQYAFDKAFEICRTNIDRSEEGVREEREDILSLIGKRMKTLKEFLPAEFEHNQGGEK